MGISPYISDLSEEGRFVASVMLQSLTPLNLVNTLIAASLALVFAIAWWRYHSNEAMWFWMLAATSMLVADGLLTLRPLLTDFVGQILPSVVITAAHLLLWAGIRRFKGRQPYTQRSVTLLLAHLVALTLVVLGHGSVATRMLVNSTCWLFISLLAAQALRGPGRGVWWEGRELPAVVLGAHAIFHGARILAVGLLDLHPVTASAEAVLQLSTIEVSIFMVALYASLLIAGAVRWNRELKEALEQVKALSGLLPICSSCKSIRDDRGYWNRVEAYIAERSDATFTHSICPSCTRTLYPDFYAEELRNGRIKPDG